MNVCFAVSDSHPLSKRLVSTALWPTALPRRMLWTPTPRQHRAPGLYTGPTPPPTTRCGHTSTSRTTTTTTSSQLKVNTSCWFTDIFFFLINRVLCISEGILLNVSNKLLLQIWSFSSFYTAGIRFCKLFCEYPPFWKMKAAENNHLLQDWWWKKLCFISVRVLV